MARDIALTLADMKAKRRLPVLQAPPDGDGDEPTRPPWQWVVFGTLGIYTVWLPLQAIVAAIAGRPDFVGAAASGAALAASALAGGFVVGRWGTGRVGVREAALAGLVSTVVAVALSAASFAMAPAWLLLTAVALAAIAVPMAALGAKLGVRRRTGGHAS
jgi:hypothetical protein